VVVYAFKYYLGAIVRKLILCGEVMFCLTICDVWLGTVSDDDDDDNSAVSMQLIL